MFLRVKFIPVKLCTQTNCLYITFVGKEKFVILKQKFMVENKLYVYVFRVLNLVHNKGTRGVQ
jgi:hypothetical protein